MLFILVLGTRNGSSPQGEHTKQIGTLNKSVLFRKTSHILTGKGLKHSSLGKFCVSDNFKILLSTIYEFVL